MQIGPTEILDTHAEAFSACFARLIVTAQDDFWVETAARTATGYATSVIGCEIEAGLDSRLSPGETPDGRPGAAILFFAFDMERLAVSMANRIGQCLLTCPTTACFNGIADAAETIPLGDWIHAFGDGFERKESTRWRIPVMDGEFVVDALAGAGKGIGGGNLVLHTTSQTAGLAAALRAAGAAANLPGVITPFPAGVCRAGSKVGSRDASLIASTAETYCPSLRNQVPTELAAGAECAYEIIINGTNLDTVCKAMRTAIEAAAGSEVLAIGGRSFGGKLGKHNIRLHELFANR